MKSISEMTMAEMLIEYNSLTNSTVKKFSDRATAERRLKGARVGSEDAPMPLSTTTVVEEEKPTPPKPSFGPKPRHHKKLSDAIRESWNNKTIAAKRAKRDNVHVEGHGDFRSVYGAFVKLNLPLGQCIKFRMAVKKAGKGVFEWKDRKYNFSVVKKKTAE
jgi:hypothetical protein